MAAIDYGSDISTFVTNDEGRADLDPNFGVISGPRVVLEAIARSWIAHRGTIQGDLDRGLGLRDWLSTKVADTKEALDRLKSALVLEALSDPRVSDIAVALTLDRPNEKLTIAGTATLDDGGTYDFVLSIDRVTSDLVLGRRGI